MPLPMSRGLGALLVLLLALCRLQEPAAGEAISLTPKNLSNVTYNNDLVLVLFYTDRCTYSMTFMPIFDAAAAQLRLAFGDSGRIELAKVDCKLYPQLGNRHDVGKFPTVKIVRFGRFSKREYRGQRSQEALIEFVTKEMRDPIEEFHSLSELQQLGRQKFLMLGYFEHSNHLEYEMFRKTSLALRDQYCSFHVNFGNAGRHRIAFQKHGQAASDYEGSRTRYKELHKWALEKCQPLVRELTFDNAEEISEEGRPLMILFYHKNDVTSVQQLEKVIQAELMHELDNINFITAAAETFAALLDIDKTEAELPVIIIDSIVHMFEFPKFEDIYTPGKLKEFIQDYHSGQLHLEHHREELLAEVSNELLDNKQLGQEQETPMTVVKPHQSKIKELLPSRNRYTFVKDEL
ncbi:hypothetical protein KR093_005666 [Drosophila rubida]|uniref:Thioredoxin domain-containing protein n=1 Tax=Drosophila rubida TaxID=30044 RepID=A0AAD4JUT7_9MUSC|nr:hypothetical protein KR093_005666 [Drosophila rubida]